MGKTKRKYNEWKVKFLRRLRKAMREMIALQPPDIRTSHIADRFVELYPNLWKEIKDNYNYWRNKDNELYKYEKKRRYLFPEPRALLQQLAHENRDTVSLPLAHNELNILEDNIRERSISKLNNKLKRKQTKCRYKQEIEPRFTRTFIDAYFATRDVNVQMDIINTLSHYISPRIKRFFYKVNAGNANMKLKEHAMHYIQALGEPFYLRRTKKGKQKAYAHKTPKIAESPQELIQQINHKDLECMKHYDVFVSHSSANSDSIIPLMKLLNANKLVAYIDWVNDREKMRRELICSDTAKVLKKRISQCRFLLIVVTTESLNSPWCAWEIGYADARRLPICLYMQGDELNALPQYMEGYPHLRIGKLIEVYSSGITQNLNDWLNEQYLLEKS